MIAAKWQETESKFSHMLFSGILTLTWLLISPAFAFYCVVNGATTHELMLPDVVGRSCTADAESSGLLTDAYLTLHLFRVLYFYVSYSNCNLIYMAKGFLYKFFVCQCLGVFFIKSL